MFDYKDIVGLTEAEANATLKSNGYRMRILSENGEHFFGTCDYDTRRVNVSIQDGIIDAIINVG